MATELQDNETSEKPSGTKDKGVHSFAMHQPDQINMVPGFERIAKLFAASVQNCLEEIVAEKLEVEPTVTELVGYQKWCDSKTGFLGMTKFHMPPCKGQLMLGIDPEMVSLLVDSFYGGGSKKPSEEQLAFTRMELQLHNRIAGDFCTALATNWGLHQDFDIRITGHETNPAYAGLAASQDMVLRQSLSVKFPDSAAQIIDLLYSIDAVRYLEALLEPSVAASSEQANPIWQYELHKAMNEVRLPVRSILARTTMTLPQIAELKEGDIIPIPPVRNLPLIIGEKVFARGSLGEQDGCAAYQIEKMEQGS